MLAPTECTLSPLDQTIPTANPLDQHQHYMGSTAGLHARARRAQAERRQEPPCVPSERSSREQLPSEGCGRLGREGKDREGQCSTSAESSVGPLKLGPDWHCNKWCTTLDKTAAVSSFLPSKLQNLPPFRESANKCSIV